jgi:NAD+ kinase
MRTIAIIAKPQKPELASILPQLIAWLKGRGFDVVLDVEAGSYIGDKNAVERHDLPGRNPELVVVLGGDGTLLAAARVFVKTGIPILSVNLGALGFLTEVRLADLYETLEGWCVGCCEMDMRSMLQATLNRAKDGTSTYYALNDVVAAKGAIARMAHFTVSVNGSAVTSFRADGVIVCTPTGSTAYNLAANGPILEPSVDALVVTAICPHQLTLRPFVVRGDARVGLSIEGIPDQTYLTVDGQEMVQLLVGDEIECVRSEHSVKLVRLGHNNFFDVLRGKLKWGER